MLNETFDKNWFFVVTNRNLAKEYKKFGETQTKLTILNWINRIFKNPEVSNFSTLEKEGVKLGISSIKAPKKPISTPSIIGIKARSHSLARLSKSIKSKQEVKHGKRKSKAKATSCSKQTKDRATNKTAYTRNANSKK